MSPLRICEASKYNIFQTDVFALKSNEIRYNFIAFCLFFFQVFFGELQANKI